MFYHQKVARVRVFADIQNFALRAWHSLWQANGEGGGHLPNLAARGR